MLPMVALVFVIGYPCMRFFAAFTIVAPVAHRLVIAWRPEAATKAHWCDVVHHFSHAPTLHAQWMA